MTVSAAFTVAGPVLAMLRSACSVIVVVTEELLSEASGSEVELETAAISVIEPVTGAATITVSTCVAPLARVPSAGQVTIPPDSVADRLADTKVTPAGSVSLTTTATRQTARHS